MEQKYKEAIEEIGDVFIEGAEFDEDELREAIMTGHLAPEDLGEAFITSVLESLGLENNLEQRRDDRIERVLKALHAAKIMPVIPMPIDGESAEQRAKRLRSPKDLMRAVAEKIVDSLEGKT